MNGKNHWAAITRPFFKTISIPAHGKFGNFLDLNTRSGISLPILIL